MYEAEGDIAASAVVYQIAEETAIVAERTDALYQAIAQLPEREQRLIRLQLDGHSYEEIAEICEVSIDSSTDPVSAMVDNER